MLREYLDKITIVYLNDILIYLEDELDYDKYIYKVIEKLL